MAVLSEVKESMDDFSGEHDVVQDPVTVSACGDGEGDTLEDILTKLVKETSLPSHHQDLLLALLLDYSGVFAQSKDELGCIQC